MSKSAQAPSAPGRFGRFANELAGALVAALLRLLGRTWRVEVQGPDPFAGSEPPRLIGAIWHRNLFIAAVLYRGSRIAVPVSRSRDGERIAAVLRRLGFADPPRGSSSRGGTAVLRALLRGLRHGGSATVLVDGPRGPALRPKLGAVALARLSGVVIQPTSFSARPCLRISSWDGSLIPLPFARVVCRYADEIAVPGDSSPEQEEAVRARLERLLNRDTDELDAALQLRPSRR